ncbi:MAG: carboxymuconolactone decarboxylase family protein [Planctomycetota bacterium]|jgi:4-carboxymuconolactone decarboxylase
MNLEARAEQSGLSVQVTAGCLVLAATVSGQEKRVLRFYEEALSAGVSAESLAEVARMAHLIGGIPRAIEGLRCFGLALSKNELLLPPEAAELDREGHAKRGLALFEQIYAGQSEAVLKNLEAVLPGYSAWIIEHAYGRVLSRPQLSPMERELLAVSALSAMRCPNQLKSHARGALHLGASREQVRAAIDVLAGEQAAELLAEAHAAIDPMLERNSKPN